MPVPASLGQLSQTASMNSPAGGENVFPDQDDYERQQFANDAILRDGAHQWLVGVSGTNTVTGSTAATSAVSAYAAGQVFRFVAAGANTGAVTLNVNGLGAKAVTKRGATALAAGDIAAGSVVTVVYDGTQFQMLDPADAVQTGGNQTVAGVKTFTSPPVVPTATASNQAVNKGQMDAAVAASVPAGAVMPFAMQAAPSGWLVCDGSVVSRTAHAALFAAIGTTFNTGGEAGTEFRLPELRGELVRGWDDGRNVDVGRTFGSWQAPYAGTLPFSVKADDGDTGDGAMKAVAHLQINGVGENTYGWAAGETRYYTATVVPGDTRPRNVALLYCIKT